MALKAKDGTEFTNGRSVNAHNARLAAGTVKPLKDITAPKTDEVDAPDQTEDQPQDDSQGKNILDDPKAMSLVDQLQQLGYTAEDVENAFQSEEQGSEQSSDSSASQAASLNIPGLK